MLSARDDGGRPFSDDVIFGNLMTMLVAGEDTTAYELGWAVHQLCDSPDSVMELRREADELLGPSDVAGDIETANKLIWAGAVANETMRLRPVTPIVVILDAKVETVVGDLLVPEGTRVYVSSRVRRRAILITSPSPRPSCPDAGSEKTPARTTYRRIFRLVRVLAIVPAAVSPCSSRDEAVTLDALQKFRRGTGGRSGRRPGKLRFYDVASGPESAPAPPLQRPGRHDNRLNHRQVNRLNS